MSSHLSDRLLVDVDDNTSVGPHTKKKSRKTRASPRLATDSLYSATATPHSDDGYSHSANEQADDLYAAEHKHSAITAPVHTDTDVDDAQLTEAELADGKQRRYTCWGACRGCQLTKTQYVLSLLLVMLLVVTTVLLVVFLAVIPAIISATIASADISVASVSITAPTNSSFRLNSSLTLSNTGTFAASLSPMTVTLSHRLQDGSLSPTVGLLDMPAIQLPGGEDVVVRVDTDFTVTDQSAFDSFIHATLLQDNITWHLSSSVSVAGRAIGISLPTYHSIPFEKDVTVSGCGGLNDTTVQSFSLSHPAATTTGNTNLTLHIDLINPSAFTISPLGTLHFTVSYQSVHIGDVYSYDTQLLPGTNQLTMYGTLLQSNTSAENEMIELFVSGQTALTTATAASDASSVPLFNGGLQGLTLQTALPGYSGQIIDSISMSAFRISFNRSTPSTALVSSFARASFALPPNVDMPVLGIGSTNITATAYLNASAPLGVMSVYNVPAVYEPHSGSPDYINITIPPSPLQVSAEQNAAFQQFAADLLLSPLATMQLQLLAAPVTDTPLGNLSLSIPTNATVSFIGMNRFISPLTGLSLMQVLSFDIVQSSPYWLLLDITLNITNPSNVSLSSLGDLRLDLLVNNTRIGGVTVPSFELPLGTAQHRATANLSKPTNAAEEAASLALVSAMINQTASNITLHGGLQQPDGSVVAGTDIALLQQAVSSFAAPTVFPGLSQPLIESFDVLLPTAYLNLMIGGCTQLYINTTMHVHNPFSTYMYLTGADVDVYISPYTVGSVPPPQNISSLQLKIGDWRVDMSDSPLVVPPHSTLNASTAVGPFLIRLTLGATTPAIINWIFFDVGLAGLNLQLDSVGTIRTNLSTVDPQQGGAAVLAFEQQVHVDALNVTGRLQLTGDDYPLPEDVLPAVTWGPPLLNNGTCVFGCKTQCTVPCYCDAVLCRYANCSLGLVGSTTTGMWGRW